jgi:hypothetical protein
MQKNVASQKLIVYAFDATANTPKTGDAANLTAYVSKDYGSVTVLGDTSATEMDSTNAKGYYLFDLTQGETNADTLLFSCKSSTANIVVVGSPATVFTTPANYSKLVIDSSGLADATTVKLGPSGSGTAQTARDVGASVLLSSGTGTGQLDFTSGVVKANLVQILATALTETAGLLAGGFKKFFNVSSPTGTLNSIPDAVAGATGGLFIAGTNAATTVTTALTTTFTGNLTGSVASVTGAVGSVTGNVGGNVTGSVGSLAAQAKADVNAEVVDTLATDTYAEPGQGNPAATTTLAAKVNYLYKWTRNKKTNDGATTNFYADDGSTVDQKQTTSESGGTVTKGEIATGA